MTVIKASDKMTLELFPEDEETDIIQNIYCILQTIMGSAPMYRSYGIDSNYTHRPIPMAKAAYILTITRAIRQYEPRVSLETVTFEEDPTKPGYLFPILEVEIL